MKLLFSKMLTHTGWSQDVLVEVDPRGMIVSLTAGASEGGRHGYVASRYPVCPTHTPTRISGSWPDWLKPEAVAATSCVGAK